MLAARTTKLAWEARTEGAGYTLATNEILQIGDGLLGRKTSSGVLRLMEAATL